MKMNVVVPRNVDVSVSHKTHNPAEIELKSLRSPYTNAPLEPAPEYGSTIMYDPYDQSYVMVSVPEARESAKSGRDSTAWKTKPRFTRVEERSLKIAKKYLDLAAEEVEKKRDMKSLEKAIRNLDDADRAFEQAYQAYPTAGFSKDPISRGVLEAKQYAVSMYQSALETERGQLNAAGTAILPPNPAEAKIYREKAIDRILSARKALAGVD
jgi:hypothetical protein